MNIRVDLIGAAVRYLRIEAKNLHALHHSPDVLERQSFYGTEYAERSSGGGFDGLRYTWSPVGECVVRMDGVALITHLPENHFIRGAVTELQRT